MATAPLLDFDALLAPIAGDDPSGGPLPFKDFREKFDDFREEIDPEDYDPEDPRRAEVQKKDANWKGIVDLAQRCLATTSKDLLVATRLAEALVMTNGFAGARDALVLLRRLVEECWDRMRPPVEEADDLEVRAGFFNWLDDPVKGAKFPTKLRDVALLKAEDGVPVSYFNLQGQPGKPAVIGKEQFEQAVRIADGQYCQDLADDVAAARDELERLGAALDSRLTELAPGFNELRKALDDCQTLARQVVRLKGLGAAAAEPGSADGESAADEATGAVPAGAGARRRPVTRDDAYRVLAETAALLEDLEPHSPVPFLIRRAVELRALRFPELVEELMRDGNVLAFLKREVGGGVPPAES